jgi:hypothetical protein
LTFQGDIPDEPPEPKFFCLRKLDIVNMTPSWASVFIGTIPTSNNQLSTLHLDLVEVSQADDTPLQVKYSTCPMEFSCLMNVSMTPSVRNAWFFDALKLFSMTDEIKLAQFHQDEEDGPGNMMASLREHPLVFTAVKKLIVSGRKYLNCFVSPCLRHLVLDYSGYQDLAHYDRIWAFQGVPVSLLPAGCHIPHLIWKCWNYEYTAVPSLHTEFSLLSAIFTLW